MVHHFAKTMSVLDDTALNSAEFGRSGSYRLMFSFTVVEIATDLKLATLTTVNVSWPFTGLFFGWIAESSLGRYFYGTSSYVSAGLFGPLEFSVQASSSFVGIGCHVSYASRYEIKYTALREGNHKLFIKVGFFGLKPKSCKCTNLDLSFRTPKVENLNLLQNLAANCLNILLGTCSWIDVIPPKKASLISSKQSQKMTFM